MIQPIVEGYGEMAHREYEAWFLATVESLRGVRGILPEATPHPNPESPRGAKEALEERMQAGFSYAERTDQPALSGRFDLSAAYARCRSFRRLVSAIGQLIQATGRDLPEWPPSSWLSEAR